MHQQNAKQTPTHKLNATYQSLQIACQARYRHRHGVLSKHVNDRHGRVNRMNPGVAWHPLPQVCTEPAGCCVIASSAGCAPFWSGWRRSRALWARRRRLQDHAQPFAHDFHLHARRIPWQEYLQLRCLHCRTVMNKVHGCEHSLSPLCERRMNLLTESKSTDLPANAADPSPAPERWDQAQNQPAAHVLHTSTHALAPVAARKQHSSCGIPAKISMRGQSEQSSRNPPQSVRISEAMKLPSQPMLPPALVVRVLGSVPVHAACSLGVFFLCLWTQRSCLLAWPKRYRPVRNCDVLYCC